MTEQQVIDEMSASFTRILLNAKLSRDELALLLKGFRKTQRRTKPSIYRELNRRFLNLVRIETAWRERREEDAVFMQAWSGANHATN